MNSQLPVPMSLPRALLVLGRASNLPTVWSNCFVAYLLGGGGPWEGLVPLLIGATLFYLGGMYLNDAFDVGFDQQFRSERPIPSGAIKEKTVWILGFTQLGAGILCFSVFSQVPFSLTVLLAASILAYDALHKSISYSPILMALCRFSLFLCVAAVGAEGITGWALWSAVALACYIIGLSYVARRESSGGMIAYWPCLLLGFPAILAYLINNDAFRNAGWLMIGIYVLWVLLCLRDIYWRVTPRIGVAVSRLLAGIVIVDLMALGLLAPTWTFALVVLFLAALLFQRFIPAT